jgi:signal recognition particle subunit SRP72
LRLDPNDRDALQTKLFLLLQTDQYDGTLNLIESAPEEGRDRRAFERAYSLYRLHREGEVRQILEARKSDKNGGIEDRGTLHLEAQLVLSFLASYSNRTMLLIDREQNYRLGAYDVACDLYQQLLNTAEPVSSVFLSKFSLRLSFDCTAIGRVQ